MKDVWFTKRVVISLALLLMGFVLLCLAVVKPEVGGFIYDDGIYLMAARALANGEGYRLTGIAGEPWLYKYPPLYCLFLSGIWWFHPQFPGNLIWLKGLNILFTFTSLCLLFVFFYRDRQWPLAIGLGLTALFATHPRLIEITTEAMSEPLFLLLSVGLLLVAGRLEDAGGKPNKKSWLLLIGLSVTAFYTRTMALPLIIALAVWIAMKVSRKSAVVYVVTTGILMLPWFLWSASRPDQTLAIGDFLVRSFRETYFQSLRMDLRYEYTLLQLVGKGSSELLANGSLHFFPLLERLLPVQQNPWATGLILGISFLLEVLLLKRLFQSLKNRQISLSGLYLCCYLAVLPFWSYFRYYGRFVVVVLPLLYDQTLKSLQVLNGKAWQISATGLIGVGIFTNLLHLWPMVMRPSEYRLALNTEIPMWKEYQSAITYLKRQADPDAVLYTDNGDESYFYALNTGRSATDFFVFLPKERLQKYESDLASGAEGTVMEKLLRQRAEVVYEMLRKQRVSYVIANRYAITKNEYNNGRLVGNSLSPVPLMLRQHPEDFTPAFQSPGGIIAVYRFKPGP